MLVGLILSLILYISIFNLVIGGLTVEDNEKEQWTWEILRPKEVIECSGIFGDLMKFLSLSLFT